jgi:hypothetical protein
VTMSGQGDIDVGEQTIDFRFEPAAGRSGLVPFFVKGPWTKPSYGPDPRGVARAVLNRLGQGQGQGKGQGGGGVPGEVLKDPAGALKSLFGGR